MKPQQAFPMPYNGFEGMTLRDYFAAKAMQAIASSPDYVARALKEQNAPQDKAALYMAAGAYHIADAMLEARK